MKIMLDLFFRLILLTGLVTALATPLVHDNNALAISGLDKRHPAAVNGSTAKPTPATGVRRPEPPLGESGYWEDSNGIVWIYYAEDKLADHAEHVRLHFQMYPQHDKAYGLATDADKATHRKDALEGVKEKKGYVRDEKMPASFDYPVGSTEVTVMYCASAESNIEGAYARNAKALALKGKKLLRIKDNRKDKTKGSPIKAKGFGTNTMTTATPVSVSTHSTLPTLSHPIPKKPEAEKSHTKRIPALNPKPNSQANVLLSRQPFDPYREAVLHTREAILRYRQLLQRRKAAADAGAASQLHAENNRRDVWSETGDDSVLGRRGAGEDSRYYFLDERDVFPDLIGDSVFGDVVV
ncbi:hypothetical protein MMC18_002408 [Xylographa bjoerkii]|nr:hypothetical protein [Xylographa bjoerkii]